ncbi:NADH:ubiquinone oxidoreductase, subunit G, iron- sulfur binding protein [Denitrovibrio acetiphilus DSM 12809]|uniref:NADH:ubiquinone oxidoreductase, subunit G, iron-sulfur binding protein n=1 Tax=Denitrovibrio acetiphilus (strain DSM 12809 / NBRC 114555 / N2460) TaxID=522772 RepID=D4H175_DENA2|nr:molybdopterin-dependent oxidoreductase [Denitrovibrio acetiphilus]ADD66823.1 NADH:ubiquinone oxidoreductase, subunit G, iron- sulfur binding protein [Denitrovibrio acetiphilus DSM 12809]
MLTVKINGKEVEVPAGTTILDAAKEAGVHIPVLCHDSRLNPFGACRVCLVEQVGMPKLQAACTTPVTDKMEIITESEKLSRVRKTAVELLLINHPLDCPVCDKGGECTLQDLTYEVGVTKVRFDAVPNDTPVDHTNPFIERDIDRCVLCGRCVRICDEVVNIQAISFLNRGTDTMIGTSFEQPWNCEYCGQCISVCPVGSLNNRVYLFKNRPWNLESEKTICGLCSCGCTVSIDYEGNEVFRMNDMPEEGVNHGYMCAKGRFGFDFMNSVKRETEAQVKVKGEAKKVSVTEAVEYAADKIKGVSKESVALVVSPRLTNEEAFLAAKLASAIGTSNVFSTETDEIMPEGTYEDVENSDALTVLNINVTESNPILGLAVRVAARKEGSSLLVFYPSMTALRRVSTKFVTGNPEKLAEEMEKFCAAMGGADNEYAADAKLMLDAEKPVLVFDPHSKADAYIAQEIKKACSKVKLVPAKHKNNSVGIVDMGCGAKSPAEFAAGVESGKIKAVVCLGENIVTRTGWSKLSGALQKLDLLMVTDPFMSDTAKLANVYIPVATFAEKNGSFTNLEGRVQLVSKAVDKGVPSDAEVLAALGKEFGAELPADAYSVRKLIEKEVKLYSGVEWDGGTVPYPSVFKKDMEKAAVTAKGSGRFYLYPASLRLHSGSYTRWSPDLAKVYGSPVLEVSVDDAKEMDLKDGDTVKLKGDSFTGEFVVEIDKQMTKGCISLPEDFADTADIFSNGRYLKAEIIK